MRIGLSATLCSYPRAMHGGVGTYIRNLVRELPAAAQERGHELELFWGREGREVLAEIGSGPDGKVGHDFSPLPLEYRGLRVPWEQLALPLRARGRSIDVFHFPDAAASFFHAAPARVVTVHDVTMLLYPESYGTARARYKAMMLRLSLRSATLVAADSEATKRDLVERLGIGEERIRVVHLGVGPEFRSVEDEDALEQVRARLGLSERFLIYVGRLEPRKNVKGLIQAYSLARRRGVDIPLVLAGQPSWLYRDVLELPRALGIDEHVIAAGFLADADLPAVYSMASAVVFPALYEGFGLPVLEAMACGTPVITSNVSSLPEIAGDAAVLVDPLDIEALAGAITRVVGEPELHEALAAAGPRQAAAFSWARTARETVAVYEEAVA